MRKRSQSDTSASSTLGASFRDPAGFIYKKQGKLYRQINAAGAEDFDYFATSGLYSALIEKNYLVAHKKVRVSRAFSSDAYAVIEPEVIPFISYPFEWSFSMLQDAALLTLRIQKIALEHGMTLKDATAYNVQFRDGKPIFIDTLSFEKYTPGTPWQAYRQFCQHFLAPLALMSYTDVELSQLLRSQLDGISLPLAAKLLPPRTRVRAGIVMHIILHGRAQKAKESEHRQSARPVSKNGLLGILDSLERTIKKLQSQKTATEWGDYYSNTNYTAKAADKKAKLVKKIVNNLQPGSVLDLGGNNGAYSRMLHSLQVTTVCTDIDPNAVEANYRFQKLHKEKLMLPLLVDLTNPGGALGWANQERAPIHERLQSDVVLALALIHHLAISNNLPFEVIANYFKKLGPYLVIEFVPKQDSQVQKLLSTRKDIFPEYTEKDFVRAFEKHYTKVEAEKIPGTHRTLYVFKRK